MANMIVNSTVQLNGYTIAVGYRGRLYEVAVFRGEVAESIGRGILLHELDHVKSFFDENNGTVHARKFIKRIL